MIDKSLFDQLERIKADECSYMVYRMLKENPHLNIKDIELVMETKDAGTVSFYVRERAKEPIYTGITPDILFI